MMKKVSYLLILFASLFIFANVKASITCEDRSGNTYIFNSNGTISTLRGKLTYYTSPGAGAPLVMTIYSEEVSITKKPYYDSTEVVKLKLGTDLVSDVCPKPEELHYEVSTNNVYTVTVDQEYYTRELVGKGSTPSSDDNDTIAGCSDITDMVKCKSHSKFSCVWVDKDTGNVSTSQENGYCNVDTLQYVACGGAFDVPVYLPRIISFIINLLKIATPIVLIFTSAISLLKAITASKEDEMEKAKKTLIRRIAIAALIFFTITITQFVIEKVADDDEVGEFKDCLSCFVNNDCNASKYYKNNIDGEYKCFYVKTKNQKDNCH